jgi:3-methyl-2-oxobutanoate hydroxymethyltransferase
MAKRKSILDLVSMKKKGEKATWVTAYDFPTASFAEQAGLDMILVGDSLVIKVLCL